MIEQIVQEEFILATTELLSRQKFHLLWSYNENIMMYLLKLQWIDGETIIESSPEFISKKLLGDLSWSIPLLRRFLFLHLEGHVRELRQIIKTLPVLERR